MKNNKLMVVMMAALTMTTACTSEYYDADDYEAIIKKAFPVNEVDPNHNWNTLSECTANISVDIESGKSYMVKIFENNPIESHTGVVMMQGKVESGSKLSGNFSYPQAATNFYIAIVDNDGTIYVQPISASGMVTENITAESLSAMQHTTATIEDEGFDMAYCFEDCYPGPGDYDFNDAVIGVKMLKTVDANQTTINLQLELRAVGSNKPLAAALHIAGLSENYIESVECSGNLFKYYENSLISDFSDKNGKKMFPKTQPEKGYEVSSVQNGDIYIPLTNDLHYSISGGKLTPFGTIDWINYNTMLESQKKVTSQDGKEVVLGADVPVVTGNVTIRLKGENAGKNITFKDMDMFIIEQYNSAYFEVHTYIYKRRPVVFNDSYYEDNVYPWALAVPGKGFRWAAEGVKIGSKTETMPVGGAYRSFPQWVSNRNEAKDWYKTPVTMLVY